MKLDTAKTAIFRDEVTFCHKFKINTSICCTIKTPPGIAVTCNAKKEDPEVRFSEAVVRRCFSN